MAILAFTNARVCRNGDILTPQSVFVDTTTGLIIPSPLTSDYETVDLRNRVLAPAFLELQTNGCVGVHFTNYSNDDEYLQNLEKSTLSNIYGNISSIKLVTTAPELSGATDLINDLAQSKDIRVSLGHSAATYSTGHSALSAGATCLTHVFNAMEPLHHRSPGLAGLIALHSSSSSSKREEIKEPANNPAEANPEPPYYSIIADGIHLHPSTLTLAFRSDPRKCILITDSIELAGLPDGLHPGNAQIPHQQRKIGNRVTIEGTDTLIGSCCGIDECVRNLVRWSGCNLAEGVRCATENVSGMMGVRDRGIVEVGRRADFVVLGEGGEVQETWVAGKRVYGKGDAED